MPSADRRRLKPANSWMAGYTTSPSLEQHCEALEDRLREGTPRPFADEPRVRFEEIDGWAL